MYTGNIIFFQVQSCTTKYVCNIQRQETIVEEVWTVLGNEWIKVSFVTMGMFRQLRTIF